ncbi:MAG: hypothetical protein WCH58_02205 [Candidatus Saccharibacteria bacterium]
MKKTEFKVNGDGTSNAINLFKNKYNLEVTMHETYGAFVTSVEGYKANPEKEFFSLLIKDKEKNKERFADLGVSNLIAKNDEEVILRLCQLR